MASESSDGPIGKLFRLLMVPDVQFELNLVGPQLKSVADALKPLKEQLQPRIRDVQNLPNSEKQEARQALFREIMREIDTLLLGVLRPEQFSRLQQVRRQKDGLTIFLDEEVHASLSLSGESLFKVKHLF